MRSLMLLSPLLLLAACADQGAIAGTAPLAVDLGGSSRVPSIAGRAGEGEGYDAVQPASQPPPRQAPMASAAPRPSTAPMPTDGQGAVDHSKMDHGHMDHQQ
jgi:hypothetical protein